MKIFRGVKFSRSVIFAVRDESAKTAKIMRLENLALYRMDERPESSWRFVYYQVSGEPGFAGYSRRSDLYLGGCELARASDRRRVILFSCVKFLRLASTAK